MTIHTVRLDTITTIEQRRRDTITISIDLFAISRRDTITISIDLFAISRSDHHISDHLRRSVIMGHLIMGHLISIDHLLTEVVDKKYNEI